MEVKRIALQGLSNTRDLGEIRSTAAPRVRGRKLIRSGALRHSSAADLSVLSETFQVRTVIDLRTGAEMKNEPDPDCPAWQYVHLPLLDDSFFGIARDEYSVEAWFNMFRASSAAPADVFFEMYRKLVFDAHSVEILRAFFRILLENGSGAVLWHCSAGKDRAGIVAALTLLALGFPDDVIAFDYQQTAVFTAEEIKAVLSLAHVRGAEAQMREAAAVLMGVQPWYIPRLLAEMRERFGSAEGYFVKNGILSKPEISALRQKYLISEGEGTNEKR